MYVGKTKPTTPHPEKVITDRAVENYVAKVIAESMDRMYGVLAYPVNGEPFLASLTGSRDQTVVWFEARTKAEALAADMSSRSSMKYCVVFQIANPPVETTRKWFVKGKDLGTKKAPKGSAYHFQQIVPDEIVDLVS